MIGLKMLDQGRLIKMARMRESLDKSENSSAQVHQVLPWLPLSMSWPNSCKDAQRFFDAAKFQALQSWPISDRQSWKAKTCNQMSPKLRVWRLNEWLKSSFHQSWRNVDILFEKNKQKKHWISLKKGRERTWNGGTWWKLRCKGGKKKPTFSEWASLWKMRLMTFRKNLRKKGSFATSPPPPPPPPPHPLICISNLNVILMSVLFV